MWFQRAVRTAERARAESRSAQQWQSVTGTWTGTVHLGLQMPCGHWKQEGPGIPACSPGRPLSLDHGVDPPHVHRASLVLRQVSSGCPPRRAPRLMPRTDCLPGPCPSRQGQLSCGEERELSTGGWRRPCQVNTPVPPIQRPHVVPDMRRLAHRGEDRVHWMGQGNEGKGGGGRKATATARSSPASVCEPQPGNPTPRAATRMESAPCL